MKLVVINACVRQADSRTLRIAEPVIEALSKRYETIRYDLPQSDVRRGRTRHFISFLLGDVILKVSTVTSPAVFRPILLKAAGDVRK